MNRIWGANPHYICARCNFLRIHPKPAKEVNKTILKLDHDLPIIYAK